MTSRIYRFILSLTTIAITTIVVLPVLAATIYTFNGTVTSGGGGSTSSHNVTLNTGDFVLARATCSETSPGNNDRPLDPVLSVFDPANGFVSSNDDGNTPACNNFDTSCLTFTAAATGSYRFDIRDASGSGPFPAPYELLVVVNDTTATCGGTYQPPTGVSDATNPGIAKIYDGRANSYELAAPLAVYCENDGIAVYAIGPESKGEWAFFSSAEEIAAVPQNPEVNTVIEQGLGIRLFRLTSGEFQIVSPLLQDGTTYNFMFDACTGPHIKRGFFYP